MTDVYPFQRLPQIIEAMGSHCDDETFDAKLDEAFAGAHCQILKFESRQSYAEGSEFDEALRRGGCQDALKLIDPIVTETKAQFEGFLEGGVRFVRCRPMEFPLSEYMKVQVEVFKRTVHPAAQTLWFNSKALEAFLNEFASHDFMIFDARAALVYEHNASGKFIGGWFSDQPDIVNQLIALFGFLSAQSLPLSKLLEK